MKYRFSWSEILVRLVAWTAILLGTYFLLTDKSQADDFLNGSLGMFHNGAPSPANVKYGEIGHRDFFGPFFNQFSGGAWIQTPHDDGRTSSGFVSDQLGIQVDRGVVIRMALGPSLISTPDSYLGGHFQFHETLFLGLRDRTYDVEIGFAYNHFSSAGFEMPNQGRDFGGIEMSIPW